MNDQHMLQPTNEGYVESLPTQDHFYIEPDPPKIVPAVLAATVASGISAILWAFITVVTGYQIGWIAIGIGFLVGIAVKRFGGDPAPVLGLIGGLFAFLGCFLGNFLTICVLVAESEGIPLTHLLANLNFAVIPDIMVETSGIMDLLFYGLAIFQGFKLPTT